MKNGFSKTGNSYYITDMSETRDKLSPGVYKIDVDPRGILFLEHIQNKFEFPYKIYGVEQKFIDRAIITYSNTVKSMGILLNGVKGTGKTVTAELICNGLNLPVVIINKRFEGIVNFINNIQQEIIVFIDEYEKIYKNYQDEGDMLSIMDGALSTEHRRVFIFTTNDTYINQNLLQRPGRIRYFKTFSGLKLETVLDIIDDTLINKEFKKSIISFISELDLITIDIVKSVVEEVNIHAEQPVEFKDVFNVRKKEMEYNVVDVTNDKDHKIIATNALVSPTNLTYNIEGDHLYINGRRIGTILSIEDFEARIIKVNYLPEIDGLGKRSSDPIEYDGEEAPAGREGTAGYTKKLLKIIPCKSINRTFKSYSDLF